MHINSKHFIGSEANKMTLEIFETKYKNIHKFLHIEDNGIFHECRIRDKTIGKKIDNFFVLDISITFQDLDTLNLELEPSFQSHREVIEKMKRIMKNEIK